MGGLKMWLFTKSGFFSAVEHHGDAKNIILRARFEGDLERLLSDHGVRNVKVAFTPAADYPYRAIIKRVKWAEIVRAEAMAIDYPNFKKAAHDGTERDNALLRCWEIMRSATRPADPWDLFTDEDWPAGAPPSRRR